MKKNKSFILLNTIILISIFIVFLTFSISINANDSIAMKRLEKYFNKIETLNK
ncbi:MAG: hypothetical protein LBC17_04655 [Lactobacillaceae bacterium]|jgi:hypothetical protein|nr:hypothetical protein [Lactobacillaceae bacterium]